MSVRNLLVATAAIIGLLTATAIYAQAPEEPQTTDDSAVPQLQLNELYHGVTPGSGNNLPRVEELKGKSGTWVTWPGFVMLPDGSSRVFLQTTVTMKYSLIKKKNKMTLRLKNAKVHLSNNRNPLITTHFNTPLKRGYLKKYRKSLDLVLEMKVEQTPIITQTVDSDGYHYLFIDFPSGSYLQDPS